MGKKALNRSILITSCNILNNTVATMVVFCQRKYFQVSIVQYWRRYFFKGLSYQNAPSVRWHSVSVVSFGLQGNKNSFKVWPPTTSTIRDNPIWKQGSIPDWRKMLQHFGPYKVGERGEMVFRRWKHVGMVLRTTWATVTKK